MRILFFTEIDDPGVGSSTRQMYQQAECLRALGHDTAVVSAVRKREDAGETEIEGMPVFRIHSDYSVRFRPWVSLRNGAITSELEHILQRWKPDVVHANLIHTHLGYHALTQARRCGAAVVFTAHDVMVFCYQKLTCFHGGEEHGGTLNDVQARLSKCIPCQRLRFRPGRNRRIREVLARDVQRFTVVSDALGDVIRANGIQVDRTVHNAIRTLEELPSTSDVAAFRARLGLEGKRVIAIGGRLHEQKGVGKLLEMLARLSDEFADVRLIVMGREEIYQREFEPQARALGVAERVVPTGWLSGDELQAAYAASDIFVSPSLCFDTFGLVNLEAMQHSKPVVATCFGGAPEVIVEGETGFLANPFDVPRYAERVAELLRDPALATRMGRAGFSRLNEHFTIQRLTDEYLEEYERALGMVSPR
ncbi:MAG: glycosyltransferase involved in cell wall biosynthesis [Chlamydiales bacterium]|jgi:glycosyltransferase involved in cell wall biosynthesis